MSKMKFCNVRTICPYFDLISTHFILSNNNMFKNEKDDKFALFITDVFFYKHLLQVLYLLVDWILNSTSVTKKDYYVNLIFKYLWPCKHNEKKISGDTSNHWSLNRQFQATCVLVVIILNQISREAD